MQPTKEELLKACYKYRSEFTNREFECLTYLIEDGTINTWEVLAEYGVENEST